MKTIPSASQRAANSAFSLEAPAGMYMRALVRLGDGKYAALVEIGCNAFAFLDRELHRLR